MNDRQVISDQTALKQHELDHTNFRVVYLNTSIKNIKYMHCICKSLFFSTQEIRGGMISREYKLGSELGWPNRARDHDLHPNLAKSTQLRGSNLTQVGTEVGLP